VYRFTNNLTQRFPSYSLPHNQYLALGRSLLVLSDISDFYNSTLCRKRATALAKNFKKNLHAINDIYIWNYWDPLPGEKYNRYVEDSIHAGIAVGFVNEAVKRKIIFNRNDLIHLSNTYVKVIWNQNILNPEFSELINGKRVAKRIPWQNWLELADVNPLILEIALSLNEKYLRIGYFRMIPPLLQICLRLNCKIF
jgi:hypothetical protein